MPLVELPSTHEDAEEQAKFKPLPIVEAVDLQVSGIKLTKSKAGESMLKFSLTVLHTDEELNGKKLSHYAMLEGEGYPFGLIEISHAIGYAWEGKSLNTDDFMHQTCVADIGQEVQNEGEPNERIVNTIRFQ